MLEDAWYCAAWSHELRYPVILSRKLLDRRIALFRDQQGRAQALDAVCPHRGADLSLGRLVEGHIQCPLHGWRFDDAGKCVCVPSQPAEAKIPPGAVVSAYRLAERQGIVWIWIGAVRDPIPDPPHQDVWQASPERRRHFLPPQLWRCSFVNAVENAIDNTHLPFLHAGLLGSNQPQLYPAQKLVVDADLRGFRGEDSPESPWGYPRTRKIFDGVAERVVAAWLGMKAIRREYYRFDLGGTLSFYIEWDAGTWDVLVGHWTPSDSSHTWYFGASIRTRATHWAGDIFQKWFGRNLSREDKLGVERMLSNEPDILPLPVSVAGDEPALTFRRIHSHHINQQQRQGLAADATTSRV
jgi:phenylpropionate dioxygenase-like ring-hydroxylating dioxygenase large terminal subunit